MKYNVDIEAGNAFVERLKLKAPGIGGYELPPSYFDTEHFKHVIGEPEPEYKDWSQ